MNYDVANFKRDWLDTYKIVPQAMDNMKNVEAVTTAFNTNIDAVIKISGKKIAQLLKSLKMQHHNLQQGKRCKIMYPHDVMRGLVKCFEQGIAEERITENAKIYDWMMQNVGYDRLQMGGQGGIVANAMAACGVKKVYAHTNSLPEQQAKQFLPLDNLLSYDDKGKVIPAYKINRKDTPLIHWILEFDKGDVLEYGKRKIICPKSNRFIVTYDPLNLNLVIDENFVKDIENHKLNYVVLSGFHALTKSSGGKTAIKKSFPVIKKWREKSPDAILHLELASTQDIAIREDIVKKIVPLVDSIGVNERETIDVLEVIDEKSLAEKCSKETSSVNMLQALLKIKEKTKCPRIQLHMFGLYITVQDKQFKINPENNRKGMVLAASVAAHKAKTGTTDDCSIKPLWSLGHSVSDVGFKELSALAKYLNSSEILKTGFAEHGNYSIIAVPTILVDNPVTLVGMGDTISSISLVGSFDIKN